MRKPQEPLRRSRLKPVSDKRREVNKERLRLQEATWGPKRWWRCWFCDRPAELSIAGACRGEVWGHEILFRSRAGSTDENLLDVENQVPLCNYHNSWVSNHSVEAHRMGLARHSWE